MRSERLDECNVSGSYVSSEMVCGALTVAMVTMNSSESAYERRRNFVCAAVCYL